MAVSYEIRNAPDVVVATYSGHVTVEQIANCFSAYQGDPQFDLKRPHLAVINKDVTSEAGFSEMFTLFSMFERAYTAMKTPFRVAIYTMSDTNFGLARIFQSLAETSQYLSVAIFESEDEAYKALAKPSF